MFSPPHEVYDKADLAHAFAVVVSELTGPAEVAQRMHAGCEEFLQMLGDTRKAGQWVAQTLDGLEWDWPRWHAYVKNYPYTYTYSTLPVLNSEAEYMTPGYALCMMTVPKLKALVQEHGGQMPAKAKKTDLQDAVMALPSSAWEPIARTLIQQWLQKMTLACRKQMGARMASRISRIAMERLQMRQRTEPGYLALRPCWKFLCDPDAPKACKKIDGKVLPVEQALQVFPVLPCDRLDCVCRITAQTMTRST